MTEGLLGIQLWLSLLGWSKCPVGRAKHAVMKDVAGEMRSARAAVAFQPLFGLTNHMSEDKNNVRCHGVGQPVVLDKVPSP